MSSASSYTNRRRVLADASLKKVEYPGKIANNNVPVLSANNCSPDFGILNYIAKLCCLPVPRGPFIPDIETLPGAPSIYTEDDPNYLINDWAPTPTFSGGSYLPIFQEIFDGGSASADPVIIYDDNGDVYDGTSLTPPPPLFGYLMDGGSVTTRAGFIIESKNYSNELDYHIIFDGNGFEFDFTNYIIEEGIFIAQIKNIFDAGKYLEVFNEILTGGNFTTDETYYTFDGNELQNPILTSFLDGGNSLTESDLKLIGYVSDVIIDGNLNTLTPPVVVPPEEDPIEYQDMPYLDGGGYTANETSTLDGNRVDIPYDGYYGNYIPSREFIIDGGSYIPVFQIVADGGDSSSTFYTQIVDFNVTSNVPNIILEGDETRPFTFDFILNGGSYRTEVDTVADGNDNGKEFFFDGGRPFAITDFSLDGGYYDQSGFITIDGRYGTLDIYRPIEFIVTGGDPLPSLYDIIDGGDSRTEALITLEDRDEYGVIIESGDDIVIPIPSEPQPPSEPNNGRVVFYPSAPRTDVFYLTEKPVLDGDDFDVTTNVILDANIPYVDGGDTFLDARNATFEASIIFDGNNDISELGYVLDGGVYGSESNVNIFGGRDIIIDTYDSGLATATSNIIIDGGYSVVVFPTFLITLEDTDASPDIFFDGGTATLTSTSVLDGGFTTYTYVGFTVIFDGSSSDPIDLANRIAEINSYDIFDGNEDTTVYSYNVTDGGSYIPVFQEIYECGDAVVTPMITLDCNNRDTDIGYVYDGNTLFINPTGDTLDGDGYLQNILYTLDWNNSSLYTGIELEGNETLDIIELDANINDV